MPTNVTPEYKKSKEAYQRARDPAERLACLKEMLRTLPKHKGTEHLQAEIKAKIKELTEEISAPKKGGRTGPAHAVRPEGAAQIVLLGPPNSGKSTLHARLTGSRAESGPYAFTTHAPLPGMLPYEDIQFQLVDLPPISTTYMESWMPNALQQARAALLVADLTAPGCVENVRAIHERLDEKRITLTGKWPVEFPAGALRAAARSTGPEDGSAIPGVGPARSEAPDDDPFRIHLPTLLTANKSDLGSEPDEIRVLEDLVGNRLPAVFVSARTGSGLAELARILFHGLGVVRVYTKIPGHPADTDRPYTLFRGDTVLDVARLVHRELADSFKFARIWGSARFDGQQVGKDHVVSDRDIVELHV